MRTDGRAPIGRSVPRVEDRRLLTGRGRFVDDVQLSGALAASFLRSPLPHARLASLDTTRARAHPGVHAVLTAADLEDVVKPLRFEGGFEGHRTPSFRALTGDKVRFVGDPIAVVVADDRYVAEDAVELIDVEYEPLEPVLTVGYALAEGAPLVFDELGENTIYHAKHEYGDLDTAFGRADRVVRVSVSQQRITSSAMETRGILADFDPVTGELVCYASSKAPHMLRVRLAQFLGHEQHKIRVQAKDVGGAFGGKGAVWREDLVVVAASKLLGRPVRWIEDRSENLTAFGGARDQAFDVEAAVLEDGTILALRMRMEMDHGAYPGMWLTPMFAALVRCTILSALRVDTFSFETVIAATTKNSYISYRGPGSVETLVRERVLDVIAAELGLDPVEVRRRNLLDRSEQPWKMPTGATVDRAHARETLESAVDLVDYEGLRAEQERARAEGRLVGIGVATSIQPCPAFPDWWESIGYKSEAEPARVRLEEDGSVTVVTSEMPSGQGHETTFAQIAAADLGVPLGRVRVVLGDTQVTPFYYFGTGASRSSNMGAGAVLAATAELGNRVVELAARHLGLSVQELELREGAVHHANGRGSLSLEELAALAYASGGADRAAVDVLAYYDPSSEQGGWAASTHVCSVEIDPDLGTITFRRYLVAEDCGTVINPAIVDGQIRGGIAQGVGATLYEHAAYDEDGQFLSGSYMSYLLPRADEVPEIEIHHLEIETDEPFAARGIGESGMVMAPAAIANAVEDALRPLRVQIESLPLTPTKLLEAMGRLPQETPAGR
jgi:aerobic carbon-monoxide dehydrogenase large subunit